MIFNYEHNVEIDEKSIPNNTTHLILGHEYNIPIKYGCIPHSVTHFLVMILINI